MRVVCTSKAVTLPLTHMAHICAEMFCECAHSFLLYK